MWLIFVLAVLSCSIVLMYSNRSKRRHILRSQALTEVLDAADALEASLRAARSELDSHDKDTDSIRQALAEMLKQRLWIKEYGQNASIQHLHELRDSLLQARQRMSSELKEVRQLHRDQ